MSDLSLKNRLRENVDSVFGKIDNACQKAGRETSSVKIIAVTKYVDRQTTQLLAEALGEFLKESTGKFESIPLLGESRPQVLSDKASNWDSFVTPNWHMIGHLQTNKIKQVVPYSSLVHSVDRLDLAKKIDSFAKERDTTVDCLVQFNISGEENKGGFLPEEWEKVLSEFQNFPYLRVQGVMGMGGLGVSNLDTADQFRKLKETQSLLKQKQQEYENSNCRWDEVSMGMSGDFDLAIENGSTIVRIGSAFFEGTSL